ncbi:methylmalonyl Co-A mutase-associated GTPase MeaB [Lewinella sp. 4G2]|uniref:methylmalonyl Co-A mutase-associated GTPase MeaB n=1 Tax=Lewinella sp. 4G2 TaxID=1803372 RepID=UPI0007B4DFA4|nr:methylmalonyl Co-A mutase-associated GTPase MeaB [Lewinella sp. 4G2]OAV43443.1 ATPase/protein kinase [Lewinella sp. 4G2]
MPSSINRNLNFNADRPQVSAAAMFAELTGKNGRRALARAITLLESTREEDQQIADELIDLAMAGEDDRETFRLGVSGTPGVGKSTFVEQFGLELIEAGHRLAVLAVDPSSSLSGGSILGDKTRMETLSQDARAFIRPSPNAGSQGGVGVATRAAILLCEAAGYDYVMVETVGVGQAEWRVHGMTDAFLLLAQPAAGDGLQSIKRGILELADHVAVNKKDLFPTAAEETARQLRQGLHLAPPRPDGWTVEVSTISALQPEGLSELRSRLGDFRGHLVLTQHLRQRRKEQKMTWLKERLYHAVRSKVDAYLQEKVKGTDGLQRIFDERVTFSSAADVLLADFFQYNK